MFYYPSCLKTAVAQLGWSVARISKEAWQRILCIFLRARSESRWQACNGHSEATQWPLSGHTVATQWPLVNIEQLRSRENQQYVINFLIARILSIYQWPLCGHCVASEWPLSVYCSVGPWGGELVQKYHFCNHWHIGTAVPRRAPGRAASSMPGASGSTSRGTVSARIRLAL